MSTTTLSKTNLKQTYVGTTRPVSKFQLDEPVVIVGNGPVGMRALEEILKRDRTIPVVIYGEENHLPYDRVKLSSWLIGDIKFEALAQRYRRPFGSVLDERYGLRVTTIDRENKVVIDASGTRTRYEKLILATGSSAHIPDMEGIDLEGVFTLRDIEDATQLFARQFRSRHTVVIGGGLLGLESARGMKQNNTNVTIIENSDRLMSNQLDETGATLIRDALSAQGFESIIGIGVKSITGDGRVSGIRLLNGEKIECDTVILATGIRPNVELARRCGLYFGRGITVDNQMLTSDPSIYAIGECAEHEGRVYGLVAPGFEHASTVANHIVGNSGEYRGSISAARLKIMGMDVFSVAPSPNTPTPLNENFLTYQNKDDGTYRRIQMNRDRLIGAVGVGPWDQSLRVQSAIGVSAKLNLFQKQRFRRTGNIWAKESANDIAAWPDNAVVCQCNNVSKGVIAESIAAGCVSVDSIGQSCHAGMVCGSCKPQLATLLGSTELATPAGYKKLVGFSVVAFFLVMFTLFAKPVAYVQSVQQPELFGMALNWHWDSLWRDTLIKQISGFSILAACALALLVSLRKRVKRLHTVGSFDSWRIAHLVFSVLAVSALVFHTGFRMGYGLNFALMILFVALIVLGIATTFAMTIGANRSPEISGAIRKLSLRLHIYLLWPIPLLLGWHILKGYWY